MSCPWYQRSLVLFANGYNHKKISKAHANQHGHGADIYYWNIVISVDSVFFDFGNSDNRQLLIFNIVFIVVVEIMRRNRNRYNYPSFESDDEEQQLLPSLASATTTRKRDNELFSEQNNNNNNIDNACLFFLYCYFVFSMLPMNFYFYFLYFCFQPMQISNEMFVIN